jgi:hypothetical protein
MSKEVSSIKLDTRITEDLMAKSTTLQVPVAKEKENHSKISSGGKRK